VEKVHEILGGAAPVALRSLVNSYPTVRFARQFRELPLKELIEEPKVVHQPTLSRPSSHK